MHKQQETRRQRRQIEQQLRRKEQELKQIMEEIGAAKSWAERTEHHKRRTIALQQIFELERELRVAKEWAESEEAGVGALPDFLIIGAKKCGTSSFYNLVAQHPHVQPGAAKELHFFSRHFDLGVEWYQRCFPQPRLKDGQRTITGEATPAYLFFPGVPEKVAEVIPQARLIVLLRNPVERTYSDYQMRIRDGREPRTFEEALEEALEAEMAGPPNSPDVLRHLGDLFRSVYVDQLLHWSRFFPTEQMLVLKSEDFFERPQQTLKVALDFLGLPEWEPQTWEARNTGTYEVGMDPVTRRTLEEYFEPHNRRLYDYLGRDLGW